MTSIFTVMLELARRLGATYEGDLYKSTSQGTTTTLVSTTLIQTDKWIGGTLFIKSGPLAGISREIVDFTPSDGTVTVATPFHASTNMPAGSEFAIAKSDYPRHAFLRAINAALRWWGDIAYTQDVTPSSNEPSLEHNLPAPAVNSLRQVLIAADTPTPRNYQPFPYWYVNKGSGKLVFLRPPGDRYHMRLVFVAPHGAVSSDNDSIDPQVHLESLYQYALAELYLWKMQSTGHDDRKFVDFYNQALQLAERYRRDNRRPLPGKDLIYDIWP